MCRILANISNIPVLHLLAIYWKPLMSSILRVINVKCLKRNTVEQRWKVRIMKQKYKADLYNSVDRIFSRYIIRLQINNSVQCNYFVHSVFFNFLGVI